MKKKLIIFFSILLIGLTACSSGKSLDQNQLAGSEKVESNDKEENLSQGTNQESGEGESGQEPENNKIPVNVVIYRMDDETGEIILESKELEELNEKELWELLKKSGMLKEDTEVISLKIDESKMVLDLNQAFGEQLRSYGTAGEQEILKCVVNTFLDTYNCEEIKITEEGNTLMSGHAEYDEYFQRFE